MSGTRILPAVTPESAFFWKAARAGRLEILRCEACRTWLHPPAGVCRECGSRDVSPVEVEPTGRVHSFTVNEQLWNPQQPPPYVLAIVALDGAEGVRLTTELVGVDRGEVEIGMAVRAVFEPQEADERVGLVLFEPDPDRPPDPAATAVDLIVPDRHAFGAKSSLTSEPAERRAVISGLGQSEVGRRIGRTDLDLTIEAALAAVADAGLERSDIDGISAYPGAGIGGPGFSGPDIYDVQDALGLSLGWHHSGAGGAGQLGAVIAAALAVSAGLATHVLCYRTVTEASAGKGGAKSGATGGMARAARAPGVYGWLMPYGAYSAANWIAMYATRYMHTFGLTREQLAGVALNDRRNAALNPKAVYRDPMDLDAYMEVRMVSTPLCLYDCDVPVDGSTAVVVSHRGTRADLAKPPVRIEAAGTALRGRPSWDQWSDLTTCVAADATAQMWSRTDLGPDDLDAAQLYDGFSILTLVWLEALGICGKGEGGEFVSEWESRLAHTGAFPLNTSGGQLSAGRLHGFGLLYEAALQLRGEATGRQIDTPEVMAVGAGGGPVGGCLLLTR
ncbi:MAG: OB-fold domain-containing protein [Acidimicrobiia bacterium]|nr:OB-fold domain-containing protein [Acidimicrobiia bacterium]